MTMDNKKINNMKGVRLFFVTAAVIGLSVAVSSCKRQGDTVKLKDFRDSVSWAIGENTAQGMKTIGYDFDMDMVLRAMKYTMQGKQQPLSETEYSELLSKLALMMQSNMKAEQQKTESNVAESEAKMFADLVAKDASVVKAPEGFYYKVIKQGKGEKVKIGEVAVFDYKGYILKDNSLIDQTYEVRDPIETLVGGTMFKGLQMGLSMMNAGSIYRFYFPSSLAFGATGTEDIPPYTAIYYDVELHSFHP